MEFIFGLATALPVVSATGVSVVTGVAQGVSEQQKQNADSSNAIRMLRFHLDVSVVGSSSASSRSKSPGLSVLEDTMVTLGDDKLWIEPKSTITNLPEGKTRHPFTGFYVAYPDDERGYTRGLVSTISVDPPMLNWIYVDRDTYEVKYSNRSGSIAHHVGSFDWTTESEEDSCITLDDFEGFVAVEEKAGKDGKAGAWAVYFDMDDDGFQRKRMGRKVAELSLIRRVLSAQECSHWGLKGEGNIGFKKTREV